MMRMKERRTEAERDERQRGQSRSGTYPQPSIVSPSTPPLPPTSPCLTYKPHRPPQVFLKKKTLSPALDDEVTDGLDCSVSVNRMIGSSGGLQQVSERGLILCG